MSRRILSLIAAVSCLAALPASASALSLHRIGKFAEPTYVTGAPANSKLEYVTERGGRVMVARGSHKLRHPFLDIRGRVETGFEEQGLLSITFAPDYAQSHLFYVDYVNNRGDLEVDEFRARSATRAAPRSRRTVIRIRHRANDNHNGGQLQFEDGLLYISTGDGGGAGDQPRNAQNRNSLLGKILRIDPRSRGAGSYGIPSSNPFVGKDGRGEIYAYGLRNPYRFSFDRTGSGGDHIVIGDVGQDRFEEVDYTTVAAGAGANFGWNAFEGFSSFPGGAADPGGTVKPIFAYSHDDGCSITGGYVVGAGGPPSLQGRYLYADFCAGQLRSLIPDTAGARDDSAIGINLNQPSSFGEDTQGRIYVCSLAGGVYRIS